MSVSFVWNASGLLIMGARQRDRYGYMHLFASRQIYSGRTTPESGDALKTEFRSQFAANLNLGERPVSSPGADSSIYFHTKQGGHEVQPIGGFLFIASCDPPRWVVG
jgi:hypothetical protein